DALIGDDEHDVEGIGADRDNGLGSGGPIRCKAVAFRMLVIFLVERVEPRSGTELRPAGGVRGGAEPYLSGRRAGIALDRQTPAAGHAAEVGDMIIDDEELPGPVGVRAGELVEVDGVRPARRRREEQVATAYIRRPHSPA